MVIVNTLPHPTQLGAVNGAGQTLASLTRGLGPLTGEIAFARGVDKHTPEKHAPSFPVVVVMLCTDC